MDPSSRALYFAYGSNMSTRRLAARVSIARTLGAARLDDLELRFEKRGSDGTGKANLVERAGACAWGVVFELDVHALLALDRFEPGYFRSQRQVTLRAGGASTLAHLYLAEPDPPAAWAGTCRDLAPSAEYLAHLLDGAREHALPDSLVAWLRSVERSLGAARETRR